MKYLIPALLFATLALTSRTAFAQADTVNGEIVTGRLSKAPRAATPVPDAKPQAKQAPSAVLAKDEKGKSPSNAFTKSDPKIFLVWKAPTAAKGDSVRVVWIAEAAEGFPKNKKLSEGAQTMPNAGSFNSNFFLAAPKEGLPAGKYRAELYDGSKLAQSLKFTISK